MVRSLRDRTPESGHGVTGPHHRLGTGPDRYGRRLRFASGATLMTRPIGRRDFLRATAAASACAVTGVSFADDKKAKLKKAVKYGMVQVKGGTHRDKLD